MKVVVVGSGGREHALLWKLSQSRERPELVALPGNGGTLKLARSKEVDQGTISKLAEAIRSESPDLVVIGPEAPLASGIVDLLEKDRIPAFGPSAGAARIESSKSFAKRLMMRCGIPTADFEVFDNFPNLQKFVRQTPFADGWVVKADGLAAGKGVFVCESLQDVLNAGYDLLLEHKLGEAGRVVVLERKLFGKEVSALFLCDGDSAVTLPPAQDYKRSEDGDRGPNTGGMGALCPSPLMTAAAQEMIAATVVHPLLKTMKEDGTPYSGVLYVGLILTSEGPQVLEFNCRFGDPETQVILPSMSEDLLRMLMACVEQGLSAQQLSLQASRSSVCVVLAADGYPGTYKKDIPLKEIPDSGSFITFHAGTHRADGSLKSTGGRVLNAVGLGSSISEARDNAYLLAERLQVDGLRYRKDIAGNV